MAGAKGQRLDVPQRELTPAQVTESLNEMVFLTLPMVTFKQLSEAAAQRQMTLSQFLGEAVSAYIK